MRKTKRPTTKREITTARRRTPKLVEIGAVPVKVGVKAGEQERARAVQFSTAGDEVEAALPAVLFDEDGQLVARLECPWEDERGDRVPVQEVVVRVGDGSLEVAFVGVVTDLCGGEGGGRRVPVSGLG
jgi:hypothetical protein